MAVIDALTPSPKPCVSRRSSVDESSSTIRCHAIAVLQTGQRPRITRADSIYMVCRTRERERERVRKRGLRDGDGMGDTVREGAPQKPES